MCCLPFSAPPSLTLTGEGHALIRFDGHVLTFEGSGVLVAWAAEDGISDAPWYGLRLDQRRRDGRVARRS